MSRRGQICKVRALIPRCVNITEQELARGQNYPLRHTRDEQLRGPKRKKEHEKQDAEQVDLQALLPLPGGGVKRVLERGDPFPGLAQPPAELAGDVLHEEDVRLLVGLVELVEVEIRQLVQNGILLRAAGERAR